MTASTRQKRIWQPWYLLPVAPICTKCFVPCIVRHTSTSDDGKRVQHRYCPKCSKLFKTTYRPEPVQTDARRDDADHT